MGEPANLAAASAARHISVLLRETLAGLAVAPDGIYIDGTVGAGGHAAAILEQAAPHGRLLGLDRDPMAAACAAARLKAFGERARVIHASYIGLEHIARAEGFIPVDGVLFDLGFSSLQVDDPERGFAFRLDGPLDMRFDPASDDLTAAELVNQWPESELGAVLREYGEEPHSRSIARAIVAARPIHSTGQLAAVIAAAVGGRREKLHPATRTFQALRIAVNRELEAVAAGLPQALTVLRPGGRLAVITFHSLEDRIVKRFFQQEARGCICPPEAPVCVCGRVPSVRLVTRKPITATAEEIIANPRSRSAKLRVVERLD